MLGPPPTSGTRDAFVELAMEGGCKTFAWVAALQRDAFSTRATRLREDGRYIEAGENDNLIVQKLESNPRALGIFGYSFLEQNADKVQGANISGVAADFDTIADGSYPVSRPLYFYVKKAHVDSDPRNPRVSERVHERLGVRASSATCPTKGSIPLPDAERAAVSAQAKSLAELHLAIVDRCTMSPLD